MEQKPIFYELLKEMKKARFKPSAVMKFVFSGFRHGIDMTRVLTSLRHSLYIKFSLMLIVITIAAVIYQQLISESDFYTILIIETGLFLFTFILSFLQLHLVRSEQSGALYQKFVFPNVLTLMRLLLIPFIAGGILLSEPESLLSQVALIILIASAFTDVIDGFLSRWLKMSSDFGRIYDPMVDYAFQTTLSIVAFIAGFIPWWMLLLILTRYWLPVLLGAVIYLSIGPIRIKSTWMGKISSFAVFFYIISVVFLHSISTEWADTFIHPYIEYSTGIILGLASLGFIIWEISVKKQESLF